MTHSRSELLLQVALDIVRSGYAELPLSRVEVVKRKRVHHDAQYRLEQLQEAAESFEYINNRKPTQRELARICGLNENSVSRLLRHGTNST